MRLLYLCSSHYTSLHRSPGIDSLLVNWNFQNLDTVFHFQQHSREVFVFPQINFKHNISSKALPPQICSRSFFLFFFFWLEIYISVHVALFSVSQ